MSVLFKALEHGRKSVIDAESIFSHVEIFKHDVAVHAVVVNPFGVD